MLINVIKVLILSSLPVIEIRGGIPLAISLGFTPWEAYFLSALGNIIIILPLLKCLNFLEQYFRRIPIIKNIYQNSVRKVLNKHEQYLKYGKYVLFLFVAIPLPTTGAWTACLASYIFRIPIKSSFWIITAGVFTAGLIVLLFSQATFTLI